MRRLLPMLLLALSIDAQEAFSVARLVNVSDVDPTVLEKSLQSSDPLVRATAARVSAVRAIAAVVPALRTALAAEADTEAARESVRAIALLGSDEDVAFAASTLARFPLVVADAFVDGIARIGTPRSVDRYIRHRESLAGVEFPGALPHWRNELTVSPAAARFLGHHESASFIALVGALTDSQRTLDPGISTVALGSKEETVRLAVLRHLTHRALANPASVPPSVRDLAETLRESSSPEERFAVELLHRAGGGASREFADVPRVDPAFHPLLTKKELAAQGFRVPRGKSVEVESPSLTLPLVLPRGLGQRILTGFGCKADWLGMAVVTADDAGRVQDFDLSKVETTSECRGALGTIARLSFARPTRIGSGLVAPILVVRDGASPPCFDQNLAVPRKPGSDKAGGEVKAPQVKNRVEPQLPAQLRRMKGSMLVEAAATISAEGCVRDVRILKQSTFADLNGAAAMALSKWTFTPGTLNGEPVDVLFNLTISFRNN